MSAAGSGRVSAADKEAILGAARRLLDRVGVDARAPVGLLALARDMGIMGVRHIPDGPDGVLVRHESGYVIGVNAQHSSTRQRFTIAHEIAHRLVNQTFLTGSARIETRQTSFFKSKAPNYYIERLCNIAASELLLPEILLQKDDLVGANPSLDALWKIARSYQASLEATGIRLIDGGWWNAVFTRWSRQVEPETDKSRIRAEWSAAPKSLSWLVPKNRSLPSSGVLQKAFTSTAFDNISRGVERWGQGRLRGWYRAEAQCHGAGDKKVLVSMLIPEESRPHLLPGFRRKGMLKLASS